MIGGINLEDNFQISGFCLQQGLNAISFFFKLSIDFKGRAGFKIQKSNLRPVW